MLIVDVCAHAVNRGGLYVDPRCYRALYSRPNREMDHFMSKSGGAAAGTIIAAICACLLAGCATQPSVNEGVDLYVRGVQASRAGQREQSIALFERAVAVNPELRMAHVLLGDAYRLKGDYERAAAHYRAATQLDRYAFANHYNLGLAYQLLNRFQESAAAYLKAIELNPRDVKSNMNLGLVYLALGQLDSAVVFLQRATQLDPSNAQALSNLGVAMDSRGNLLEAESIYRRALELDSKNLVTQQNLAQNLISQNKGAEAIVIMEQVVRQSDTPPVRKRYSDALVAVKKYDEAIAQLDLALKTDSRYILAINGKANIMLRKYMDGLQLDDKLRTGALELWRSSLRLNPNQPQISEAVRRWENPGLFGN
jgi:tetratricopeptide (TPR) repeat protein